VAFVAQNHAHLGITLDRAQTCKSSRIPAERRPPLLLFEKRTSLRPSTAYVLCKLARCTQGDILLDCTCGVGTVPVEAAHAFRCVTLGGDLDAQCQDALKANLQALRDFQPSVGIAEGLRWDAT
jgi:tRNA G10  N-methylase Trm11